MINTIISGITEKLLTHFGEIYKIYTDKKEGEFVSPSFYIKNIEYKVSPLVDIRHRLLSRFAIGYKSDKTNETLDRYEVEGILHEILQYITVGGDLCRGTAIEVKEDEDGVRWFYVSYNMFILKEKEKDPNMERIDVYAKTN